MPTDKHNYNKVKKKTKNTKTRATPIVTPTYNPQTVIEARKYGIIDLKAHIGKIKKNIKIFEEAIKKEKDLMKRDREMIVVLKNDIKEAKIFKKLKKTKP